jgi:hypothetical protein
MGQADRGGLTKSLCFGKKLRCRDLLRGNLPGNVVGRPHPIKDSALLQRLGGFIGQGLRLQQHVPRFRRGIAAGWAASVNAQFVRLFT